MEGNQELDDMGIHAAQSPEMRALTARVAELELQVAALASVVLPPIAAPLTPPRRTAPPPQPPAMPQLGMQPLESTKPEPHAGPTRFAKEKSLEDRLGSQVFNLIGMVALIFGAAWALKLAIEHGLIGPTARVILGLVAGSGVILASELFRRKGMAAFSYSLKAVGSAVLYLSLWAAFHLYGILPASVALVGMVLVTAWNAFMALSQDAELLAGYALLGALLTPLLLSTGDDHETFLFTYLASVDLGSVLLQRYKSWPRLLPPAFLATAAYFAGYFVRFFHNHGDKLWDAQSSETAVFTIIFFGLFALVSMRFWSAQRTGAAGDAGIFATVLIPLANAAFLAGGLSAVFEDSGLHTDLAWLMVTLAALFLGLMRLQRTAIASAIHLAAAVVFLTIAIPLKASGQTLTTAWLVEGLVLYWASSRADTGEGGATTSRVSANSAARVLALLSIGGYVLGLISLAWHWSWHWAWPYQNLERQGFFNHNLASALVAVAVLAGAVWLAHSRSSARSIERSQAGVIIAALSAIDLVALLLTHREFIGHIQAIHLDLADRTPFANADFATALVGLALLAGTTWIAWRSSRSDGAGPDGRPAKLLRITASADLVLFNLATLAVFVKEIGTLFTSGEADLQRSLAISAFLMLYAAVLLAAGFWRRSAFVRWQALILILFTIAKVFLYDISGLSAGYRVASFLALGALLMTVSFAYQKDWLGLKTPSHTAAGDEA